MIKERPLYIFINYRRVLCKSEAILIHNELSKYFGADAVFLDSRAIIPGDIWENQIIHSLNKASILLSLIPPNWVEITDPDFGGRRKIDLEHDWVRKEIHYSIIEGKRIIPLMIEGGVFPKSEDLPENIQDFVRYQNSNIDLRIDNIRHEILRIVNAIEEYHKLPLTTILKKKYSITNNLDKENKRIKETHILEKKFSQETKRAILKSRAIAVRLRQDYIGMEQLLLGILHDANSFAVKVLNSLEVEQSELIEIIEENIDGKQTTNFSSTVVDLPLDILAERVINVAFFEAQKLNSEEIGAEHIILSILRQKENLATRILNNRFEIDHDIYKSELEIFKI